MGHLNLIQIGHQISVQLDYDYENHHVYFLLKIEEIANIPKMLFIAVMFWVS